MLAEKSLKQCCQSFNHFFLQFHRSIHLAATTSWLQSFSVSFESPKMAGMFQTGPTGCVFFTNQTCWQKKTFKIYRNDFFCRDQTTSLVFKKKKIRISPRCLPKNSYALHLHPSRRASPWEKRNDQRTEHGRSSMNKRMGCFQAYLGASYDIASTWHQASVEWKVSLSLESQSSIG